MNSHPHVIVENEGNFLLQKPNISLFVNTSDSNNKLLVSCNKETTIKTLCRVIANIYYKTFVLEREDDGETEKDTQSNIDYENIENSYVKVDQTIEFNGFILPNQHKIGDVLENKAMISAKIILLYPSIKKAKTPLKIKIPKPKFQQRVSKFKNNNKENDYGIYLLPDEMLPPKRSTDSKLWFNHNNFIPNQQVDNILESIVFKKLKKDDSDGTKYIVSGSSNQSFFDGDQAPIIPTGIKKRGRPKKISSDMHLTRKVDAKEKKQDYQSVNNTTIQEKIKENIAFISSKKNACVSSSTSSDSELEKDLKNLNL